MKMEFRMVNKVMNDHDFYEGVRALIIDKDNKPNWKPNKINDSTVLITHEKEYFKRFTSLKLSQKEIREIGFPLSKELVEREMEIAEGTIRCVHYAIKNRVSMNIAGGTHHAFYNRGEAFCMLNDQAIAANYILNKDLANRVMIIDLDVHQGNGTAALFNNNSNVFTLSFHGKNNYPFRKEKSDLDIALEDGTDDQSDLSQLEKIIPSLFEKVKPDFVFYLCGVDVLASDKLGRLGMSVEGCKKRDAYVLNQCKQRDIPVQCSMGGGYSKDIKIIIEAHANTYRVAKEIYT